MTEKTIITAGGTISEVIHELGHSSSIIATDITSTYPKTLQDLPSIGYRNQIKAEGILALGPDQIFIEEGYLNEDVVRQLKESGLEVFEFPKPKTVSETKRLIEELGVQFKETKKAESLIKSLEDDLTQLAQQANQGKGTAAFIMARGPETVFLAGENTFAEELFELAGLTSAAKGFKDFIPLTPEALITLDPDHIILFESGLKSLGGKEGLGKIPGIEHTKAFQKQSIHAYDGLYLSGFGPRIGKAALELSKLK